MPSAQATPPPLLGAWQFFAASYLASHIHCYPHPSGQCLHHNQSNIFLSFLKNCIFIFWPCLKACGILFP